MRAVHKETRRFFFNVLLYLQINETCHLQSTYLHSWYTTPNICSIPGTCFAGRRKGPVSNFLLSPLPSEIGDLLVRISTLGKRKSPQGPNLVSRVAGGATVVSSFIKNSWIRSDASADVAQILQQHNAPSVFRSKSDGKNFYRFLLLRQLHGKLGDDFDESQQALSQRDLCPLMWKSIQIWGRLRWTFCLIRNAGTTFYIAYGSRNPLHKPVAISEKSP